MRRLIVACLLLGACGTGATRVATQPEQEERAAEIGPLRAAAPVDTPVVPTTLAPATVEEQPATVPEPTTTTAEPPRPPVTAASRSRSPAPCGGWEAQVAAAGDWNVADACSVMGCESTFDPTAINGRYRGLMQVDGGSLDGETNLAQAFALWNESRTWRRWSCKP